MNNAMNEYLTLYYSSEDKSTANTVPGRRPTTCGSMQHATGAHIDTIGPEMRRRPHSLPTPFQRGTYKQRAGMQRRKGEERSRHALGVDTKGTEGEHRPHVREGGGARERRAGRAVRADRVVREQLEHQRDQAGGERDDVEGDRRRRPPSTSAAPRALRLGPVRAPRERDQRAGKSYLWLWSVLLRERS